MPMTKSVRSGLLILFLSVATSAGAATLDDIVALSKAGVSDAVLLALIERDKAVYTIEADQLIALKAGGVSEAVVIAMLKSGREPAPPVPPPALDPYPTVVIVGHGPDRPNTTHRSEVIRVAPYVPYAVFGSVIPRSARKPSANTKPKVAPPESPL